MKLIHSSYTEPINADRERKITEMALLLMKKWNNQKLNKKAPAVTEANNSNIK